MNFESLLLALSISDSSDMLGILNEGQIFVNGDLKGKDKSETIDHLISAQKFGYECCVVTRYGIYAH